MCMSLLLLRCAHEVLRMLGYKSARRTCNSGCHRPRDRLAL